MILLPTNNRLTHTLSILPEEPKNGVCGNGC